MMSKLSVEEMEPIVKEWFQSFSEIVKAGDTSKLSTVLSEDGYWRDLLMFSWDYRTLSGIQNIQTYLSKDDVLKKRQVSNLKLEGDPQYTVIPERYTWIISRFSFETDIARGSGLFRLSKDKDGKWKAHTMYTGVEELKGHEEPKFDTRPQGVDHGENEGRLSWRRKREIEKEFTDKQPQVLIIGAGQAGLMIAARLKQLKVDALIIDKNEKVGDNWRKRYEFLVLHDPVWYDHMPYIPFPPNWPIFTPKDKLAAWFEQYAQSMELNIWMSSTIEKSSYDPSSETWTVDVNRGDGKIPGRRTLKPKHVILATGHSGEPNIPTFPGQENFKGILRHSSQHTTGQDFSGKKAVVVGCCNSGHDIAHDFYEQGAETTMVQRSSTYICSSKAVLKFSLEPLYMEHGPPVELADTLNASLPVLLVEKLAPLITAQNAELDKEVLKGLEKVGFKTNTGVNDGGFFISYFRRGGGYYLDVGASTMIADGKIKVKQGQSIDHFEENSIVFEDGSKLEADTVVLATGYKNMKTTAERILGKEGERMNEVWGLDDEGELKTMWRPSGHPALWAMGGNLALCRFNSKNLAIQIKARLEGIAPMDKYEENSNM